MPWRYFPLAALLLPLEALACSPCRTYVLAAVFDHHFGARMLMLTLPVLLLVALAFWIHGKPPREQPDGH